MKNAKSCIQAVLFLLVFVCSTNMRAASVSSFEVSPLYHTKTFILSIETIGLGEVDIKILDQQKRIVYAETINGEKYFEQKINLEKMPDGNYFLQVEDDREISTQILTVNNKGLEVNKKERRSIYKPKITLNNVEKHLDVNWLMNEFGNFKIVIDGENSKRLFEYEVKDIVRIHERFDISNLPIGVYHLVIGNGKQNYYKEIHIE